MSEETTIDLLSLPFTILVADDEEPALALVEATLCTSGVKLLLARSGDEAVELCRSGLPDLAILDWQMPGMSGLEVCRWIKEQAQERFVPVIMLTSLREISDKVQGLNNGADDYMTKPFSIQELEARVRALLRTKVLADELRNTKDLLAQKEKELVAVQVAGAAAHELGQPLTSLLLNCELLQRNLNGPADSATTAMLLEMIAEQCQRVKDVVDQLQQVTTYQTKGYTGSTEILDLARSSAPTE